MQIYLKWELSVITTGTLNIHALIAARPSVFKDVLYVTYLYLKKVIIFLV